MLKIGLTGGIGSGKSVVAHIFSVLGIPVFDADKQAKLIMESDQELMLSIRESFSDSMYTAGKLNRDYLANIVFTNPAQLEVLNALVHPATIKAADTWMKLQTTPYAVKEAALMFEAGSATHLNCIIGVSAPLSLRIKRVMERDGVTRDQVLSRVKRQIDESIKMKLCDFVIVNDEQSLLIPQVLQLHANFTAIASTVER